MTDDAGLDVGFIPLRGATRDQVKRALERLTREGLVATYRSDGKTAFVVVPPQET